MLKTSTIELVEPMKGILRVGNSKKKHNNRAQLVGRDEFGNNEIDKNEVGSNEIGKNRKMFKSQKSSKNKKTLV